MMNALLRVVLAILSPRSVAPRQGGEKNTKSIYPGFDLKVRWLRLIARKRADNCSPIALVLSFV